MLKRDIRRQADTRSPVANDIQIVGFYSGTEPDHRGRYVHEIQAWPDDQLETIHDYIQWLFPLPERSGFNVAAPVLTRESIQEFRTQPDLQQHLRGSFLRMMTFYGLETHFGRQIAITRAPNFATKATGWLSPGNHNHLRIRRILRCLTVLGWKRRRKHSSAVCLRFTRTSRTKHYPQSATKQCFTGEKH